MNIVRRTSAALLLLLAVGTASTGSGQTTQTQQAADEAAIRLARSTHTKALAANDIDRVVSYWTSDITIRRALGQTLTGVAEARKVIEPPPVTAVTATPAAPPIIYQREAVSVTASTHWPLAFEEGRWSGHVGGADAPALLGGRYSAQWVKRDGKWLIRSEVFVALTCAEAACKYPAAP